MKDARHTVAGEALTRLILEIFQLNGRLLAAGDALVGDLGMTAARWQVMGAIAYATSPEPVARLARNMGLTRQGVQRIVDELAAEGVVTFEANPHHKRAKLVVFTKRGRAIYEAIERLQAPWANALAKGLGLDALESARELAATLRARLDAGESD